MTRYLPAIRLALTALLIAALLLVTVYLVNSYVHQPLMSKKAALAAELNKKELQLAELRRTSERLPALREKVKEAQTKLDYLGENLPPDTNQPSFLTYLELGAEDTGVSIVRLDFAELIEVEEGYLQLPVHLTLVSRYPNVVSYLDYLERIPRAMRMESLDIKPQDDAGEGDTAGETQNPAGEKGVEELKVNPRVRTELGFSLFIDPASQAEVMAEFRRLRDKLGRTDPFGVPETR